MRYNFSIGLFIFEILILKIIFIQASRPRGKAQFFNSNGPLQVGGLYFGADRLRDLAFELGVARETLPVGESFAGCMRDMRVAENDGSARWISLGTPADGQQYQVHI